MKTWKAITAGGAVILAGALLAVALLEAPAGASSTTSIPKAQAALAALSNRPTKIPVKVGISKPIPSGKTIDFVVCGVPECTVLVAPLQAAAAKLGWTIVPIPGGLTPETILNAWDQIVQNHPDGVLATGFPSVLFSNDLAKLEAAHIPVVDGFVTDPVGNGIVAVVNGTSTYVHNGSALADYVLGKNGTATDAVFVGGTTFPASQFEETAFLKEYKKLCSTCKSYTLNEPATAIGAALTSDIVATLTRHRDINFVVLSQASMASGLPQAMKTAGLKAQILVNTPDATTVQYLAQGLISGIMVTPNLDMMPQMIDALARSFVGDSVSPDEAPGGLWVATQKRASWLHAPFYLVPNYLYQFGKLWGK
jgi:ribose transport system substrate-binding protein